MNNDANKKRLNYILAFFGVFVALGFILISVYGTSLKSAAISMVWILACVMAGGAIGFLFGIPKILQPSSKSDNTNTSEVDNNQLRNSDYRMLVNTNLTEISDWLTKIIVGLGLVNLSKIPPYINSIATSLSNGINANDKAALAFAYGIIICYTVLGFLFGYLFTRLVLSQAFADADRASIQQVKEVLSSQSIQLANLESKQGMITQSLYPSPDENEENKTVQQEPTMLENQLMILNNMAVEYMNISAADWAERTRLKDTAANAMADYALKQGISKTAIFRRYMQDKNEGMALALASLINIKPETGDIQNVLSAGQGINRLHVRYRFLLAIVTLHKKGFINEKDKTYAFALVNSYKNNADQPLLKMIDSTLSTFNN